MKKSKNKPKLKKFQDGGYNPSDPNRTSVITSNTGNPYYNYGNIISTGLNAASNYDQANKQQNDKKQYVDTKQYSNSALAKAEDVGLSVADYVTGLVNPNIIKGKDYQSTWGKTLNQGTRGGSNISAAVGTDIVNYYAPGLGTGISKARGAGIGASGANDPNSKNYDPTLSEKDNTLQDQTASMVEMAGSSFGNNKKQNTSAGSYGEGQTDISNNTQTYAKYGGKMKSKIKPKLMHPKFTQPSPGNQMYGNAPQMPQDNSNPMTFQDGGGMPQMPQAPQQPQGGDSKMQQVMAQVAQELQQGANPRQVIQELIKMGVPQDQAMQMVQSVAQQMQQPQENNQQQVNPQVQQQQPQMKMGGMANDALRATNSMLHPHISNINKYNTAMKGVKNLDNVYKPKFADGGAYDDFKLPHQGYNPVMKNGGWINEPMGLFKDGGIKQYQEGGEPNAQLESRDGVGENFTTPDGKFGQMPNNTGTHEQQENQSNPNGNVSIPNGTVILSAKLKPIGSKKTFADLNKRNNTNKQDKVLSDVNAPMVAKTTAKLIADLKSNNTQKLFAEQEALKKSRVADYARKMGVDINSLMNKQQPDEQESQDNPQEEQMEAMYGGMYKDGGIHIKPSHVGRFTAYKQRTGKTTEEALHSSNAHVRQMANFARNAAKWKHEMGGMHLNKYQGGGSAYSNLPVITKDKYLKQPKISEFNPELVRNYARILLNTNPNEEEHISVNKILNKNSILDKAVNDEYIRMQQDNPEYTHKTSFEEGGEAFPQSSVRFYQGGGTTDDNFNDYKREGMVPEGENMYDGPKLINYKLEPLTLPEDPSLKYNLPNISPVNPNYKEPTPFYPTPNGQLPQEKSAKPGYYVTPNKSQSKPYNYQPLSTIGSGLAQSAGALYTLGQTGFGKKYDTVNYKQVNPTLLDNSEALKSERENYLMNKKDTNQIGGGNQALIMGNLLKNKTLSTQDRARILEQYQNANADITNQAKYYNTGLVNAGADATRANQAASRNSTATALDKIGSNVGNVYKDTKSYQNQDQMIKMVSSMYPEFGYDANKGWFYHKVTGVPLDLDKSKNTTNTPSGYVPEKFKINEKPLNFRP